MTGMIRTAVLTISLLLPASVFANPATYQLRVDGLACPFCAYGIEKELTRADGVESIDIDINASVVTVTMAEGATLSEEQAKRIVKDAGFTLAGFKKLGGPPKGTTD